MENTENENKTMELNDKLLKFDLFDIYQKDYCLFIQFEENSLDINICIKNKIDFEVLGLYFENKYTSENILKFYEDLIKYKTNELYNEILKKIKKNKYELEIKKKKANLTISIGEKKYNFILEEKKKEKKNKLFWRLKYKKDYPNIRFKATLVDDNTEYGNFCEFESFVINNEVYLISANNNTNSLDVYLITNEKKFIKSLPGHRKSIVTLKYFEDNEKKRRYLISGDYENIIYVWDVNNDFNLYTKVEYIYSGCITQAIAVLSEKEENDCLIVSCSSGNTKKFNLHTGKFTSNINISKYENSPTFYLILWDYNNETYLIELCSSTIYINKVNEKFFYGSLFFDRLNDIYRSGITVNQNKNYFLYTSTYGGYLFIWDLIDKSISSIICLNTSSLFKVIQWNEKYALVADFSKKTIKVIDLEINKCISEFESHHSYGNKGLLKIKHPKFGNCLLSSGIDNNINLWTE